MGYQTKRANAAAIMGDPWQFMKEFVIKPLVRKIANSLENKIVNSVNKQISNIDGKSPSFITNWRNHMLDSQARGNDVFRAVLADTQVCGFMSNNVKSAFGADKFVGAIAGAKETDASGKVVYENKTNIPGLPSFQSLGKCTLPSSFDVKAFNKDFSKGSWQAWNKLLEPQNNLFGFYALALNEQQRQMETEKQATMDSAVAGQGFLSQKLGTIKGMEGTATAGVGPSGCTTTPGVMPEGQMGPAAPVTRCTFMGKDVTPAQVLGKTAAGAIDAKLKRPGAASELTDIVLGLFAAVVNGTTSRLANFIGQTTYDKGPGSSDSGYNENQFEPGSEDSQANDALNQVDRTTNKLNASCQNNCETTCTDRAKTMDCSVSATGGTASGSEGGEGSEASSDCQETVDQAVYDSCMSDCTADCPPEMPPVSPPNP